MISIVEEAPSKPSRKLPASVPPVKPSRRQKKGAGKESEKVEKSVEPADTANPRIPQVDDSKTETTAEEIESLIDGKYPSPFLHYLFSNWFSNW